MRCPKLRINCRIESASYFLSNPGSAATPYAEEFAQAIEKLVGEIETFQEQDGYLNVYFTVVDPEGRFQNLRDMHEMCTFFLAFSYIFDENQSTLMMLI